jgi:galactokinase
MLCCRAGDLSQYSFCPVHHERQVRLPAACTFVIAVTGVVAEKTGAARETYNRASLAAREVLRLWNQASGRSDATLRAAVEAAPDATSRIRAILSATAPELAPRFDQFVEETFAIIPEVGNRLAAGHIEAIGELVDRSQAGAERGLRNQVPETVFLARSARQLGALAASAFGAGFGGSVWALTRNARVADFCAEWRRRYCAAFPERADRCQFFPTRPGPAAIRIETGNPTEPAGV